MHSYNIVADEVKAFGLEKALTRGRTNHNLGRPITYLVCKEIWCNAKNRFVLYMETKVFKLETAQPQRATSARMGLV